LDSVAPVSVANFLQYVNAGYYDSSMIHRTTLQTTPTFGVVQGGGYDDQASPIPQFAPIVNEYHLANRRGTLAMARTANPDSATSQWYFNTTDNSTPLAPPNPFAVFGWAVGTGMSTIDAIAALPTFPYAPPFGEVPLQNFTQTDFLNGVNPLPHLVLLDSVTVVANHPSFQNPLDPFDVNNDGVATAVDQLLIVNHLVLYGPHAMDASYVGTTYQYLDTNGDGQVSELDLVPEPSTFVLGGGGLAGLLAIWSRRRLKRGAVLRARRRADCRPAAAILLE
jgi:peptidyl-prolyl cis-trans isomerase A (cyclophilin A)